MIERHNVWTGSKVIHDPSGLFCRVISPGDKLGVMVRFPRGAELHIDYSKLSLPLEALANGEG